MYHHLVLKKREFRPKESVSIGNKFNALQGWDIIDI